MKLIIEIEMDTAAFDNGSEDDPQAETARILRHIATVIFHGNMGMTVGANCPLRDINGNKVGTVMVAK